MLARSCGLSFLLTTNLSDSTFGASWARCRRSPQPQGAFHRSHVSRDAFLTQHASSPRSMYRSKLCLRCAPPSHPRDSHSVWQEVAPYHNHWDSTHDLARLRVLVAAKLFPDGTLCSIQLEVLKALQNADCVLTTPRSVRHPLHGRSRWYADRPSLVEYIFCLRYYVCVPTRGARCAWAISDLV
jgi:hypothetical protein